MRNTKREIDRRRNKRNTKTVKLIGKEKKREETKDILK